MKLNSKQIETLVEEGKGIFEECKFCQEVKFKTQDSCLNPKCWTRKSVRLSNELQSKADKQD